MADLHLITLNESKVRIDADVGIIRELAERFTFRPEGYMFTPAYKFGSWDGYIRLIDTKERTIPKGLVPKLIDEAEASGYTVSVDKSFQMFKAKIDFDHKALNLPVEPYDYQLAAVERILSRKRQIILSATGSGKSLILYMMARALEGSKILIIVPTISLVTQLFGDFKDYSVQNDFDVDENCHMICEGAEKVSKKPIIISTWQSLQRQNQTYFEQYDVVISDEVHTAAAAVLSGIMNKCINAFIRVGLTGTLQGSKINELQLVGLFGPVHRVSSTADLMERNILTELQINAIILKYPETVCAAVRGLPYKDEIATIIRMERRNKFISKLVGKLEGNTLVLFQFVQHHGKVLEVLLREMNPHKTVHFVYGGTDADMREKVRQITEQSDNVVILASSQVYSTGVNIKKLHNIVFASPSKAKIRVLQSIGRGLRKHESKSKLYLYDIVDDFRGIKKTQNYALKHFAERVKIYIAEKFKIKTVEVDLYKGEQNVSN